MRIAFSGTGNSGKTTMVKSFLHTWSNYTTPDKTYREVLQENDLSHSSKTTTDTQSKILNFMIDQVQPYDTNSKVVFDRCPLDNIAYSLWAHEKKLKGFTKQFLGEQIDLMKESLRSLDIIFVCRFDEKQVIEEDGFRDTDKEYIQEVDNIFLSLFNQYTQNPEADIFFPKGDSPAIIELPHSAQERIDMVAEYVNIDGNMYGEETSMFSDIARLEQLVNEQKHAHEAEEKEKELYKRFGL